MNRSEILLIDSMLDRLSEVMGAAGCNDYDLPDTPENRELVEAAYGGEEPIRIIDGKIVCFDFVILDELRKRLTKEL